MLGRRWEDNIKLDLEETGCEGCNFGFHKGLRIIWVADRLFVSYDGLCSMKLE
jgi:hypothetical protein